MELATYTQLKADLNTLGENLDLLKELESANAEAKALSGKKLQIMQNLLYILELGGVKQWLGENSQGTKWWWGSFLAPFLSADALNQK